MTNHRALPALLLLAACAAPLAAGEILIPLSAGTAADTAYTTRVWVTNPGAAPRKWTPSFIAQGADGTRVPAGKPLTVAPGATVLATNLAPAGQGGLLLVSGAPQLALTARLEAAGKDGALRAAVAAPLVTGREVAAARATLQLHGLSHKQGGLVTDLFVVNASRKAAQCSVDAYRDDGSRIGNGVHANLPALSVKAWEKALATFGAADVDEARIAVSCDQPFYAYARVAKPGSGELNVVTPTQALGRPIG
jgi:hypothetical protein